ncbi:MAG: hypothetical protein ACFFCS_11690 [Candidatus Hodarchaeota archaeon]
MNQSRKQKWNDKIKPILNTAGQWEQDTKSRTWSFIEPVFMMSALQILMWGVWLPMDLADVDPLVVYLLMGLLGIYLVASPFIHADTFKAWGMNPLYLAKQMTRGKKPLVGALIILGIFTAIGMVSFHFLWGEIANALFVDPFDMNLQELVDFQATFLGETTILVAGAVVGFLFSMFIIRWDNMLNSLKIALYVILILGGLLFGYGLSIAADEIIPNMAATFLTPEGIAGFGLNFFGYIFWGALQQVLFASYFGTRFRKAFTPRIEFDDPDSMSPKEKRKLWPKRLVVSIVAGSYFGLIHVPSWNLTMFTSVLGVVLTWFWFKDKNRNLIGLGIIHGFLGSVVGAMFSGETVSMSVGPGAVPDGLIPNFWMVGICLAAQQVLIVVIWCLYELKKRKSE